MKAIRIIALTLALTFIPIATLAGDGGRRIHYGIEWGLNDALLSGMHSTFLASEGYVVDSKSLDFSSHVNAHVLGFVEVGVARRFSLAAYSGYIGLKKGERVAPVTIRGTYALSRTGIRKAGAVFAEGGCGFRKGADISVVTRTGYAYRYRLADFLALDFNAGMLVTFSHPDVYDKYSGRYVPEKDLGVTRSLNLGLIFAVGLVF